MLFNKIQLNYFALYGFELLICPENYLDCFYIFSMANPDIFKFDLLIFVP